MDSGVRIVTRGEGKWLQGRRHVIDAITGRSQHTRSRAMMRAISKSLVTYITITSIFCDRSSSNRLNGIYSLDSRCTGDGDERRQGGRRNAKSGQDQRDVGTYKAEATKYKRNWQC